MSQGTQQAAGTDKGPSMSYSPTAFVAYTRQIVYAKEFNDQEIREALKVMLSMTRSSE